MRSRRVIVWVAGLALAIQAVGMPLIVLEGRMITRVLSERYSRSQAAGLPPERMTELAEAVRAFVVRGAGELPAQVDGRPGFDQSAVSHLDDVGRVLRAAHVATGFIAAGLALWLGWAVVRRRLADVAAALRIGAAVAAGGVSLIALVALLDFNLFFSAFHGLFFAAGTWTFPYDSLLIQLFPEPFWATLGAAWGVLVGLVSVVYWIIGCALLRKPFGERA